MLDNGRLGNIVATPLLLLPKWIGSMIALCCLIFSIWGSLRLAGIYSIQSVLIPYALCMWMFLFPWWENMGALTYQFNYLFSMALCTWLLLRLFKAKPEPTGVFFSGWQLFFLGLFAGCSHEGMSVPILVGLLPSFGIQESKNIKILLFNSRIIYRNSYTCHVTRNEHSSW